MVEEELDTGFGVCEERDPGKDPRNLLDDTWEACQVVLAADVEVVEDFRVLDYFQRKLAYPRAYP